MSSPLEKRHLKVKFERSSDVQGSAVRGLRRVEFKIDRALPAATAKPVARGTARRMTTGRPWSKSETPSD
jgi:hypothetical protein